MTDVSSIVAPLGRRLLGRRRRLSRAGGLALARAIAERRRPKLLDASRQNNAKEYFPFTPSPNNLIFDYTADGVKRSIEDSLQRLGIDALDIVFVHDLSPDNPYLPTPWEEQFEIARKGAFSALTRMREEGIIKGWGLGVNRPEPIMKLLDVADPDVYLLASQLL